MSKQHIKFFSLKPRNNVSDVKNYSTYKAALDYCFSSDNDINNIGVIGDYGTGKSTIINTYLANDLDDTKYDVLNISLLTLEESQCSSTDILKNIIKQIVHNPYKSIAYNILKFQPLKVSFSTILILLTLLLSFILIFFCNSNLLSSIPVLNLLLEQNIPIELFRAIKYFLLITIILLFTLYSYHKLLAGLRIQKLKVASAFDAEVKRTTEDIVSEELDYLEYLIYLLKRKKKNLLLVVEDLDRYNNLKIFQQLREVNNILNNDCNPPNYKFIYAVGNSLFSEKEYDLGKIDVNKSYHSNFKEHVTKFFDFVVNIIPVMDNQNSYEFIKRNFPHIVGKDGIDDEDLFMLSQYIATPRILIDVVNDFQVMKDMRIKDKGYSDAKLLYYSILKSRFFNFFDLIHEVFDDLELIARLYQNKERFETVEAKREYDFYSLCTSYALEKNELSQINRSTLTKIWLEIKNEVDLSSLEAKYGNTFIVYSRSYSRDSISLNVILEYSKLKSMEYVFSSDKYRHKLGADLTYNPLEFSALIGLYYGNHNETIKEIIKYVEVMRYNNPNKVDYSVRDFLDIDFVQLGIQENLLDINDYNLYVSLSYLETNDANFLRQFNLYANDDNMLTIKLYDIDSVLSKMRLDKIIGQNGLNVYIIAFLQSKKYPGSKADRLKGNAINQTVFITTLLTFNYDEIETTFNKSEFLSEQAKYIRNNESFYAILMWYNSEIKADKEKEKHFSNFLSGLNKSFQFAITDTDYLETVYTHLLSSSNVIKDVNTLIYILNKIDNGYEKLANVLLTVYSDDISDNMGFNNAEWLPRFNENVSVYIPILSKESIELMQSVYSAVGKVKVDCLSELSNMEFLSFIYVHNLYEYSPLSLATLFELFSNKALTNYSPFIEYSYENFDLLKSFRVKNELAHLDLSQLWVFKLVSYIIGNTAYNALAPYLQFFKDANPIVIDELSALPFDNQKLTVMLDFISLFKHTLSNLKYIYESLESKDPTQLTLLDDVLTNADFNYALLIQDVSHFDQNPLLKERIYNSLYTNDGLSSDLFATYMLSADTKLIDGSILSSQEKLRVLFSIDRIEFSVDNLTLCNSQTLSYILSDKSEALTKKMSEMTNSGILNILRGFDNRANQIHCLVSLFSCDHFNTNQALTLTVSYLQDFISDENPNTYKKVLYKLLAPLRVDDQDIDKIISLLENGRGQRTVSSSLSEIAMLLSDKGIVTYSDTPEGKILLKHN